MASVKKTVDGVVLEKSMKKYRLDASMAAPFVRKAARKEVTDNQTEGAAAESKIDVFRFRIRYGVDGPDGSRVLRAINKCPIFTLPSGGIVQTENPEAQQMIENFIAPNRTERNGVARQTGKMFMEYKGAEEADIDLDFHLL